MITRINDTLDASRLKRQEGEKGFTLIELLVVVIIIGILAAIAIPVFLNQRQSAWKSSVESDLKNAALAVETFGTTHNGSLTDLGTGGVLANPNTILPDFTPSADNLITLTVADNAYTITGTSDDLDEVATYDSGDGGLTGWVAK